MPPSRTTVDVAHISVTFSKCGVLKYSGNFTNCKVRGNEFVTYIMANQSVMSHLPQNNYVLSL